METRLHDTGAVGSDAPPSPAWPPGLPGSRNGHAVPADPPAAAGQDESFLVRIFHATEEENRSAILRALPSGRGGDLLDIGTHDGAFTEKVAQRLGAGRTCGLELLEQHADAARARGIDVTCADVERGLPYPDASFDTVHANQVIEHLRHTDRFLQEIHRVLRPGGLACISTNNLSSWHNVVSLALGWQPFSMHVSDEVILGNPLNNEDGREHVDAGRVHVRVFTMRALRELCEHHGLAGVHVRTAGYYPLPPRLARVAAALDRRHGAFIVGLFERRQ